LALRLLARILVLDFAGFFICCSDFEAAP